MVMNGIEFRIILYLTLVNTNKLSYFITGLHTKTLINHRNNPFPVAAIRYSGLILIKFLMHIKYMEKTDIIAIR